MAAKNTISQRITLDGANEIKTAFEALGKAGEQAFKKIRDAADKASPGLGGKLDTAVENFKGSLAELDKASASVGRNFTNVRRSALEFGSAIQTVGARVAIAAAAVTGATVALAKLTQNSAEAADAVGKSAQGLGLSTKAYQELAFAAAQSGVSSEDFTAGFTRLNKAIGEALSGNKAAIDKFQKLGVSIKNANGTVRPASLIFADLAEAISKIPNGAERAAVGSEFFGKSVAKWLPLILEGRDGINALRKEFAASGLGFTDKEIANATAFNDSLSALGTTLGLLRDKIFIQLTVPFRRAFDALNQIIAKNSGKIISLAQRIVNQLVPIFEDIFNALIGNDRAVKAKWILDLRKNILYFGKAASDVLYGIVIPAFNTVSTAANTVASAINSIFGTEITGKSVILTATLIQLSGALALIVPALNLIVGSGKLLLSVFGLIAPALGVVSSLFALIVTGAQAAFVALGALATWPVVIVAALVAAGLAIYAFWDEIVAYTSGAVDTIKSVAQSAWDAIAEAFYSAWDGTVEFLSNVFEGIRTRVLNIWQGMINGITSLWGGAVDLITSAANFVYGAINRVISSISSAINRAKQLIGLGGSSGYASGGYVSGPGTGTSDSIPAWLSNGEYVIRASAVRKYGSAFLSAINNMRLSPGTIPQFNMGGLVESMSSALMPRFADGGLVAMAAPVGGGRPVNVTIGGEMFSMNAPDDVAEKLVRYASRRRVASAGRKPSWYGA